MEKGVLNNLLNHILITKCSLDKFKILPVIDVILGRARSRVPWLLLRKHRVSLVLVVARVFSASTIRHSGQTVITKL